MSTVAPPRFGRPRAAAARAAWLAPPRPELAVVLVVAGLLHLWGLTSNGWANEYYSAAVRSMSSSGHAFLYVSFDPAGVMSVDKPPLALGVQVAFVEVFGRHALSMLVPRAQTCTPAGPSGVSSTTNGLYDCAGKADALAGAAS